MSVLENAPASLCELLADHDHEVDPVTAEDLTGHPGAEVAAAAQAGGRLLISLDKGFGDIHACPPGPTPDPGPAPH